MLKLLKIAAILTLSVACKSNSDTDSQLVQEEDPITWTDCSYELSDHPCNFELSDQNGSTWNLYDHIGEVIVLDFSTGWCYYCHVAAAEIPVIEKEYEDKNLTYVTILIEDNNGNKPTLEYANLWADTYGINNSPVLIGDRSLIDGTGENGWSIAGWPTFFFIDHEMVTRYSLQGYSSSILITTIDKLLIESSSSEH